MLSLRALFKNAHEIFVTFPKYIIARPFKGFDEMKTEKRGSMWFAMTIFILSSLMNILDYMWSGFIFNHNNPYAFNSLYLALITIFPVLLFVLANWSVTTLMDGKGKMKEIFMTTMYAMFPLLIARIAALLLSNVLTQEEGMIIGTIRGLGSFLFFVYLFIGLVVIHEYSFSGGIAALLLTVLAMMVIQFILMLLLTLASDFISFVLSVIRELTLKYL